MKAPSLRDRSSSPAVVPAATARRLLLHLGAEADSVVADVLASKLPLPRLFTPATVDRTSGPPLNLIMPSVRAKTIKQELPVMPFASQLAASYSPACRTPVTCRWRCR